jgi:hypothetical protein
MEIAWGGRIDVLSKMLIDRIGALSAAQIGVSDKLEKLEARINNDNKTTQVAVSVLQSGIEKALRESTETAIAENRAASDRQHEQEARVRSDIEITRFAVSSAQTGVEKALRDIVESAAAENRAASNRQMERIGEFFEMSSSSLDSISAASSCISDVETRLSGILEGLKKLTHSFETLDLDGVMGVSGLIIRQNYVAACGIVSELESEALHLNRRRKEIESIMHNIHSTSRRETR